MDIFYEQFLTKDYGEKQRKYESIGQALILLTILNIIFVGISLAAITIAGYILVFILARKRFLEFEYELTDTELVISKIMNKKSRKLIGKINIENVVEVTSAKSFNKKDVKIINASLDGIEKDGLKESILLIRVDSNLIGYKIAMDKKLQGMCRRINPIIFK